MKLKLFSIFLFLFTFSIYPQTIKSLAVVTENGTKYIPVYIREGTIYISVKPFADAVAVYYFYNPHKEKLEISGPENTLYITAKNPFLVMKQKGSDHAEIIQLPTSTYLLNHQVFIPLKYCFAALQTVTGMDFQFKSPATLIVKPNPEEKAADNNGNNNTRDEANPIYNISNISIQVKANGTLLRISSNKRIYSYNSSFKQGILTIILRHVHADVSNINSLHGSGMVEWIKARNIKSDTELRLKLRKDYTTNEVLNVNDSNDILIALYNKIFANKEKKKKEKAKWNFNVIVIDPGHGGKDSGTIGVGGIEEKNINLAIALKLGRDIKRQMKGVKVVFTRKTDRFVELYRRGQIANEAGGNLFISIHCNSTPRKPSRVNGFEVYLLRPGRTKEAISIAERENSVIKYEDNPARYKKLTDENFILVSMAQSAYMRYSEKFADMLDKEFSKDISIKPLGVKQAGFYVLVGASMPSVLIETGFLSNRKDARYLNSKRGQARIAEAIVKAIEKFRKLYEKNIKAE